MEELQQMLLNWCSELEDYLKCDQCQQKLSQDVYLCDAGHFICCKCSQSEISNTKCLVCKLKYTKVRNYLAESLVEKLETVVEKLGAADDDDDTKSMCSNASMAWNSYQCWIGKCKFQGTIDEAREHYQSSHGHLCTKNIDNKLPHKTTWNFDYGFPKPIDRILNIPDVGLFLVHIVIYDNGALRAHLLMYDSGRNAKKYQYKMKVKCNNLDMNVKAEVDTCRMPRSLLSKKGIFVPRAHILQQEMAKDIKFTVELEIEENSLANDSRPSDKNRNRYKTRKQASKSTEDTADANANVLSPQNRNVQQTKPKTQKENREKGQQSADKSKTDGKNPRKQDQKKPTEKNPHDVQNKAKKMDNCLQQSEATPVRTAPAAPAQQNGGQKQYGGQGRQFPGFVPFGGPPNHNSTQNIPPLIPPQAFSPGQTLGYHQPPQYAPLGIPGNPQHFGSTPVNFPGAYGHPGQFPQQPTTPTAPVEDGIDAAGFVKYPDLTRMKKAQDSQRVSEIQRKIDERERAARLGRKSSNNSDDGKGKDKDKCVIC